MRCVRVSPGTAGRASPIDTPAGSGPRSVWRQPPGDFHSRGSHCLAGPVDIETYRRRLQAEVPRVPASALSAEMARGALVVDTRSVEQRTRDGVLPGAVIIDRNVLEWRLDPASEWKIPEAVDHDVRVIIVCNEGYSSSLAAMTLRTLGLHRATDLVGGYQSWLADRR